MDSSSVCPVSFAEESFRRLSESLPVIARFERWLHSWKTASGTNTSYAGR